MKNTEAIKILKALNKLDTYHNEHGNDVPYHFGAEAVFAIGKNIRKLTTLEGDLEKARIKLVKALLKDGEKEIPAGDARLEGLVDEITSLYEQESDFKPHKFKTSALKVEINPVPGTLIAILEPLFLDETIPAVSPPPNGGV